MWDVAVQPGQATGRDEAACSHVPSRVPSPDCSLAPTPDPTVVLPGPSWLELLDQKLGTLGGRRLGVQAVF